MPRFFAVLMDAAMIATSSSDSFLSAESRFVGTIPDSSSSSSQNSVS
jgi:hypothetical protein